jgi:predicted transposase YbfD/YdcC
VEQRTIWTSGELAGWRDWPGLASACMIRRQTWNRTPGSYEDETAYLIGSMDHKRWGPEVFLEINRMHWSIENRLHHVRDVTMGEDACRVRTGSAPQILAGLRNSVLALLRRDGWTNIAAALRHHAVKVSKALKLIGIAEN